MKKSIFVLAILAIAATGAFAQGFSKAVGGGLLFDYSLNNGIKIEAAGKSGFTGTQALSAGGFGFLDVGFAELDVSFAHGTLTWVDNGFGIKGAKSFGSALQLGLTLLGKYPIDLGSVTLFPLLGADYNLVFLAWNKDGHSYDDAWDLSQFGLLAGAGFDFNFTTTVFFRAEALFHLRFPSKVMKDLADESKSPGVSVDPTLGVGPRVKVGLGYRF